MNTEDARWKGYIENHLTESRKSAYQTSLAIQNSPLEYEVPGANLPVAVYTRTLQIPKFFTQTDKKRFESICSTFYTIFEKTIDAYRKDPAVRRLFHFPPTLNRLIYLEPGYQAAIPVLRIDIFYNEETGDFKVCEFNTDGTSAMFENNRMFEFLSLNNAWNALAPDVEYMELMDTLIDALLEDIREATGLEQPKIVISDFLENAYLPELYAFARRFQERGYVCEVADIRRLDYDGQKLFNPETGTRFDALYRRAVTRDIMDHLHDVAPFLLAANDGNIVLLGSFKTQIPHSKMISEAIFQPELQKYFTEEEKAFIQDHMPEAFDLTSRQIPRLLEDRQHWIIKPKDSYGAKGVWAGVDVSQKLWEKLVRDFSDMGYIVEEYIPHYQSLNIDLLGQEGFRPYSNLTGLYVWNGKFAGVYSRLSSAGIVSTQYNERMVPTLFLKDHAQEKPEPDQTDCSNRITDL